MTALEQEMVLRVSFSVRFASFAITQNPESFIQLNIMEPEAIAIMR